MKFTRFWLIIFIALIFSGTLFIAADICFADDSGFSDIKFTGTDAVIIRYKGNVKIREKNDNDWMIPAVGMKLKSGTRIKTGKTASYIELMLNYAEESSKKNVVRIEYASSVELTKISPNNTQILLDKGELFCILQKTSKGTHFEIKTPVAICGAKGTGWKVTHNPKTIAYCFESKIFMQPLDDQGQPTGDRSNINEGHKKTMGARGFIGPTKRIGSWQKRRWNSWMRDLGEFCNKNLSRPSGKTADPYTAPPESTGGNLNKDVSDMSKNSDSQSKDARDNKKNEQNVQGSALRGDTDKDSDGDGVLDKDDLYPTDPNRASGDDLDGDGVDDEFDSDIDGDGVVNSGDAFPRDYYDQYDADSDGWGNNEDAFADDSLIDPDSQVKGYGSRYEMRQKIYDLIEEGDIRNDIAQHRKDIYWRDMDARMTQLSDAQLHKVMTDRDGYRVRVEQYVLRPADKTIQLLNVNLRTAGDFAGLTTLNWTMNFNRDINADEIHDLPWDDYLKVIGTEDPFRITSNHATYQTDGDSLCYPKNMTVRLAHNDNAITEVTTFGVHRVVSTNYWQDVTGYSMDLTYAGSDNRIFNSYADFKDATLNAAGNPAEFVSVVDCDTTYSGWTHVGGFTWQNTETRTPEKALIANFFVINNDGILKSGETVEIAGLADMLRVGYFDLENGSNLEGFFRFIDATESTYSQFRTITAMSIGPPGDTTPKSYGNWSQYGSLEGTSLFSGKGIDCILVPVNDKAWETDFSWWGE